MAMADYLPQQPGLLPKWLLFISLVSVLNTVQAYSTLQFSRRVYPQAVPPVTPLSSRTFGTWTLTASAIRFYAAYRIDDADFYQLVMCSYAIALFHFGSELLVYKTTTFRSGSFPTFVVSIASLVWMGLQYNSYVKG